MPLVRGDPDDDPERPPAVSATRKKMLTVAALIASFYLVTTSLVTTVLIPAREFEPGGDATGEHWPTWRTITWGTRSGRPTISHDRDPGHGASALAGLLNIVPRYLPRYGMAPEWARRSGR